jgi:hypothetical protein
MKARGVALAALLGIGLALNGCALIRPSSAAPDGNRLGPGRRLILARISNEENRASSEAAAGLLLNAMRDAGRMLGTRDLLAEARGVGLGVWAAPMLDRLQSSGWPTPDESRMLLEQFSITTVVVTDLTSYEQVWGKYGKFTRVGLEAQAYDLRGEHVVWRLRKDAEIEDMRGRAFQYAMEQAVQDLADAIYPRTTFSVINVWRYWRR